MGCELGARIERGFGQLVSVLEGLQDLKDEKLGPLFSGSGIVDDHAIPMGSRVLERTIQWKYEEIYFVGTHQRRENGIAVLAKETNRGFLRS